MIAFAKKSAVQCGLIVALLVALTYGMLTPAGVLRASGQDVSGANSTPLALGTPVPLAVPSASPAPTAALTPTPSDPDVPTATASPAPVVTAVTPGTTTPPIAATPLVATPTFAPRPAPPGTPAATPTTVPGTTGPGTPGRATPTSPSVSTSPTATARLTPTITPTRRPSGVVSAEIVRDLSPLSFRLNGREQIARATLDIAVSDTAPATQQPGWSVSVSVDQFRITSNASDLLPADAVTLLGVTVTCADDTGCTMPGNDIAYPFIMPNHAAVTIVSAAPGSGSGRFVITPTFAVRVPATASAGAYTTSIAVDIASGAPVLEAQTQGGVPTTPMPATVTVPLMFTPNDPPPTPLASPTASAVTVASVSTPAPVIAPAPAPPVEEVAAEVVAPARESASVAAFLATDRIGTVQAVNLRSGPGVTAPTQGLLPTGTRLAATGATRSVAGVLWRQFSLADGRTGWVRDLDVLPVAR